MASESTQIDVHSDQRIRHPLDRLRGMIRRYVSYEGILTISIFMIAWFCIGLVYDYGIFRLLAFDWALETPKFLRSIVLVSVVITLLLLIVFRIINRVFGEFSPKNLALLLEKRFKPELGGRLITAVELADVKKASNYGYSASMLQRTIDEARERVAGLPVREVLNYRRLYRLAMWPALICLGLFLGTAILACTVFDETPGSFIHSARDTSAIWVERNILLRNTPWPRHAYLEIVDFAGAEKRIGKDQNSPRLRIQAYEWVWADDAAEGGWRPLTWADLTKALPGETLPELPLSELKLARMEAQEMGILFSSASAFRAIPMPQEIAAIPDDPAEWRIDKLQRLLVIDGKPNGGLIERIGEQRFNELQTVIEKLQQRANDSSMSRTLRRLHVPASVRLAYTGQKSRVKMDLRAEGENEFVGVLADLKESVDLYAKGDDYYTPSKRITLVPAPTFVELHRDEYRPAYLYQRPPFADSGAALQPEPMLLKGLKQTFAGQGISLSGDKSRFEIVTGTELDIVGTTDKDLLKAEIVPKPGRFPGVGSSGEPIRRPMVIDADGKTVHFSFNTSNQNLITKPTEFEIYLLDTDHVSSKRVVQIIPEDDAAPDVEVVVETLRKSGSYYLCTPKALIPFAKESKIRDKYGLNKVEYVYRWRMIESAAESGGRAAVIAGLYLGSPVQPSISDPMTRLSFLKLFGSAMQSDLRESEPETSMLASFTAAFTDEARGPMLTVRNLQPKLQESIPSGMTPMITYFDFKIPGEGGFDIQRLLPGFLEKSEGAIQKHYLLTLNVRATDTNVETGPKIGENREPFLFKIISEDELLAEIAREQNDLSLKIDEAIRRLEESLRKQDEIAGYLPIYISSRDYSGGQSLSTAITENLAKAHDLTSEVATDYNRIRREFEANRYPERRRFELDDKIVRPLANILTGEFPRAEETHASVAGKLNASNPFDPAEVILARQRTQELITRLKAIRNDMGVVTGINELVARLQRITEENDRIIRLGLASLLQEKVKKIFAPQLKTTAVTVEAGAKFEAKIAILWKDSPKEPYQWTIKYPADAKITGPEKVDVNDEMELVSLKFIAGNTKGDFEIQVIPSWGDPIMIKVKIK